MYSGKRVGVLLLLLAILLSGAAAGFAGIEGLSLTEGFYLALQTMTTLGYGDLVPVTPAGRAFAVLVAVMGIGFGFYAIGLTVNLLVEGHLGKEWAKAKMYRRIEQLRGHVVVCGAGRVGFRVIEQLLLEGRDFVVIEARQEALDYCKLNFKQPFLHVLGDATRDEILLAAGLVRARALVTTLPSDTDNLFVSLTARVLNPEVFIVARAELPESEEKLRRAGADRIVSPATLGGIRMATAVLKPASIEFVDTICRAGTEEIQVEEVAVDAESGVVGESLASLQVHEATGAAVVGMKRGETFLVNPPPGQRIEAGDVLLVLGSRQQLEAFERLLRER